MRSWRSTHNLIAVSANDQETAINTEGTLDTSMLVATSDVVNLEPRRQNNADELTGKEEPDTIYDLGALAATSLTYNKMQPQHAAFVMAYALGEITSSAKGDGYEHAITPIDGDVDNYRSVPSFTLGQRYGKTVLKRLFASMFVDSFTLTWTRDDWIKLVASIKGTGKVTSNMEEETVADLDNVEALTLAANAVEGADAQTRLDNVQRIRVDLDDDGTWTEVEYSAVSDAEPAVITITDPGGAGEDTVSYKILYIPDEAAWCTFPARVTETPLKVSQVTFTLGGAWNGTTFDGGRELDAELNSLTWTYNNNLEVTFGFGADGAYANRCFRSARSQTLKLDREFRDYILQQHIDDNDTFGVTILAEGALYDATYKYQMYVIFPKVGVVTSPISVNGKIVAEAGDLQILEDDTYGSVMVIIQNLVDTYAA
jgi:hypothetical protein